MVVQGKGGATTGKLRSRASTPEECQSRTLVRLSRLRNRSGIPCRGAGHLLRRYPHVSIAFWPLGSSSFILHPSSFILHPCSSSPHSLLASWPPPARHPSSLLFQSPLPFGVHCFPRRRCAMNILVSIDCLHCLSAFTAFPANSDLAPEQIRAGSSSLPFGVHCFPRSNESSGFNSRFTGLHCLSAFTAFPALYRNQCSVFLDESSLPFGVHCFPRPGKAGRYHGHDQRVFIAFRRSLLSPLERMPSRTPRSRHCLHCLSAFTAFPAGRTTAIPVLRFASSLPFGVHCFPRRTVGEVEVFPTSRSSLPFGVHCFPRWGGVRDRCSNPLPVFIAFRRSLLSPRTVRPFCLRQHLQVFIAFRRSLLSPQYVVADRQQRALSCLHCLSAFTAFPALSVPADSSGLVSVFIAFRRSLLSPHGKSRP